MAAITRDSCIKHPEQQRFVAIRRHYVEICDGDTCAAAILGWLENWTNSLLRSDKDPWIYRKQADLKSDLYNLFPDYAITAALKILRAKGYLETRRALYNKRDRTLEYRLLPEAVQRDLNNWRPETKLTDKPCITYPQAMHNLPASHAEVTGKLSSIIDITIDHTEEENLFAAVAAPTPEPPIENLTPAEDETEEIPVAAYAGQADPSLKPESESLNPPAPVAPLTPAPEGYHYEYASGSGFTAHLVANGGTNKAACGQLLTYLRPKAREGVVYRLCEKCNKAIHPPPEKAPQPHVAIIEAYHKALPEDVRPPGEPNIARNARAARDLRTGGFTPEQVTAFVQETYPKYRLWARRNDAPECMTLEHVRQNINAWLNRNKPLEPPRPAWMDSPELTPEYLEQMRKAGLM